MAEKDVENYLAAVERTRRKLIASYGDNYKFRAKDFIPGYGLFNYSSRNTDLDIEVQLREKMLASYNMLWGGAVIFSVVFKDQIMTGLESLLK